ncbi:hypothetical protein [Nocardia brasiliensis]|uniref:hypothetical protein n=1 Tax=Nocardia brasiliensis TaxID=37326 RepID=UPI00366B0107
MKNIESSGAAASARSTADDTKMLVVVQLMQMNWPTLDKQAATVWVDKWLQKQGLGGR